MRSSRPNRNPPTPVASATQAVIIAAAEITQGVLSLLKKLSALPFPPKLIVISASNNPESAARALRAGAHACLSGSEDHHQISAAIRDVLAGHLYLSEAFLGSPSGTSDPSRP